MCGDQKACAVFLLCCFSCSHVALIYFCGGRSSNLVLYFFFLNFGLSERHCLIVFRDRGRERERNINVTEKHHSVASCTCSPIKDQSLQGATQVRVLTWNQVCGLSDNGTMLQPAKPHQPDPNLVLLCDTLHWFPKSTHFLIVRTQQWKPKVSFGL